MLFLQYPPCSTCKKAKNWLDDNGISYTARHIKEENPSYEELKSWVQSSGLPLKKFFNTSGLQYRALELKDRLPNMTEEEQLSFFRLALTLLTLSKGTIYINAGEEFSSYNSIGIDWELLDGESTKGLLISFVACTRSSSPVGAEAAW